MTCDPLDNQPDYVLVVRELLLSVHDRNATDCLEDAHVCELLGWKNGPYHLLAALVVELANETYPGGPDATHWDRRWADATDAALRSRHEEWIRYYPGLTDALFLAAGDDHRGISHLSADMVSINRAVLAEVLITESSGYAGDFESALNTWLVQATDLLAVWTSKGSVIEDFPVVTSP